MRKGQGLVEYGLILGLIAVVAIAALSLWRDPRHDRFRGYCSEVDPATHNCRVTQLEDSQAALIKRIEALEKGQGR